MAGCGQLIYPQGIMTMKRLGFLAVLVAVASMTVPVFGSIVFDNSTNYLGSYFSTTNEFGDQIKLIDGIERLMTQFKFEYYGRHDFDGTQTAQLRIYDNTGIGDSPKNLLYDSGPLSIRSGINYVQVDWPEGLYVPDTFTWTVQFGNLLSPTQAGLLLFDPVSVGSSYGDFWEKVGGAWGTQTIPGTVANFGAQVTAIVPEPTIIQYGLLGGLIWLAGSARRRFFSSK
jgi:hypothetical protein